MNTSTKLGLGALVAVLLTAGAVAAVGQGMMGGGYQAGGYGMSGYGGGQGGGMMGGGYGRGWGGGMMGWGGPQTSTSNLQSTRISMNDARNDVVHYLQNFNDPNLVVDEVMNFDRNLYVLVKEKNTGRGAFELLVDPYSGWVSREPGPDMMWNAKYSPMGWRNQAAGDMTVNVAQARQDAQNYLNTIGSGYSVEEHPDVFYGYYTAHVLQAGKIIGMLSVNGYTGQVWYHSWHGTFLGMEK